MRIGHISYGYKPIAGGQEVYISNLSRVLEEAGHSQRVYQPYTGIKDSNIIPIMRLPSFLQYRAVDLYAYNLFLLLHFKELQREDALVVHYAFHYPTVAWHKNCVIVSHGAEWEEPPTRLNHKIRKTLAKKVFENGHCKLVANDTDYLRRLGLDIKPKQGMFQEVVRNKWFIPNCVDTSRFHRNEGLEDLKRLNPVLVPRNIVHRRGIDLAIRAFSIFVREYPLTHLLIVGGGANEANPVYRSLCTLVKELNLEGKVIFKGFVPWERMPWVYSSSLMTLIPSLFGEGTSLSALESMACGIATIATKVGGLMDLPCVLTEPNPESLAETMLDVFVKRDEIAKEQEVITRNTYNLDNWSKAWLSVISSCR